MAIELADYLGQLGTLSSMAGSNPALMLNRAWIVETAGVLSSINIVADEMDELGAPDVLVPLQRGFSEMATLLRSMTRNYATGVDNQNPRLLLRASDQMNEVSTLAVRLTNQRKQICG